MRRFLSRHPLAWSLATVFLFAMAVTFPALILIFGPSALITNGSFFIQFYSECFICICGIVLTFICGYGFIWDQTKNFWRGLLSGGYMVVWSIFGAAVTVTAVLLTPEEMGYQTPLTPEPLWKILVFAATMFLIGVGEETFYRGIVANLFWDKHAKDPDGIRTAVIYSGIIFGMMHMLNLDLSDPTSTGGVLVQVCSAMIMGMALTAIYYRSRNLWVVIFLHGFWDFCGLLSAGLFGGSISETISSYSPIQAITSSVPFLIVTLVLLRKSKLQQMLSVSDSLAIKGRPSSDQPVASSEDSRRSRKRAVAIVTVLWVAIFLISVLLSPVVQDALSGAFYGGLGFGSEILSVENSGSSDGEPTFGSQYRFAVDESGNYRVRVDSDPSEPNAYVLVQITDADGEVCYEDNFGGRCQVSFTMRFDKGEYILNLVYNYSELEGKDVGYKTRVTIG